MQKAFEIIATGPAGLAAILIASPLFMPAVYPTGVLGV